MDKTELFNVLDAFNALNKLNVPNVAASVEQEEQIDINAESFNLFVDETLRRLIIDEHEAISGYENFRVSLLAEKENTDREESKARIDACLRIVEHIIKEENKHVGQLEELLGKAAKEAKEKGEEEGEAQVAGQEDADKDEAQKEPGEDHEAEASDEEHAEDADPFDTFGK